ncbi:hypothetical protein ACQCU1_03490 [Sutcliffiella horikoshii]|uniref:hypothetical protein n=1 Tax=Sutcliffiella horikoshii TaxID=79883 RepID=UPI003CF76872
MIKKDSVFILFLFIPVFYFGYKGQTVEMGLAIVAAGIFGAFLNLDKFKRFSGAGFEAELKQVVNEAYATLEVLKTTALPIFKSSLATLAYGDRFVGISNEEKQMYIKEFTDAIQKLDILDDDLNRIIDRFHYYQTFDLYREFLIVAKFEDNPEFTSKNIPGRNKINEIVSRNQLTIDEKAKEKLEDYLFYKQHNTFRSNTTN